MPKITRIILYDEPNTPQLNITHLSKYLSTFFNIQVNIRTSILDYMNSFEQKQISKYLIHDLYKPFFEQSCTTKNIPTFYDAFELQRLFAKFTTPFIEEFGLIFTNMLVGTYDYNDYRYHTRAIICSNPSILSINGMIMAPARPREYYIEKQFCHSESEHDDLEKKFKNTCLYTDDPRIGQVACGYAVQSIFYYLTGDFACQNLDCILYNAHWQKDLLYSQLESGELCKQHKLKLESLLH